MKQRFDKIIEFIFEVEGEYTNNPDDPGGETKFGISKRRYPNLDIKNLTKEEAKALYYKDYWKKAKCYLLPLKVAAIHFDTAVNLGVHRANKFLQKSINNISEFNLAVDGIIGPKTSKAILTIKNYTLLEKEYLLQRVYYYFRISQKSKKLRKFFYGWIYRIVKLSNFLKTLA